MKLWLMVPAIAVTFVLAQMMRGGDRFDRRSEGRLAMSFATTATLVLWLGVIFLGRGRWVLNFLNIPLAARLAGAISLVCWIAVVAFGRWTAYYMF